MTVKLKKQKAMKRGAGVLLPVSSLPSPYGIGSFGREAYAFVDFLKAAGQRYWQVLPLGPTSYGDSPYQSFSAFSGNPYFIDLDTLIAQNLLTQAEVDALDWGDDPAYVDYAKLYRARFAALRLAFSRSEHHETAAYQAFLAENVDWLDDYAQYMALKTHFGGIEWLAWREDIRLREPAAVAAYAEQLTDEASFWRFCQYEFFAQWARLKTYANASGVEIIGDIPIYAALDSADVWVHGEQFQLDENRYPTRVAGVPPDLFSTTGQLWGNPLYNWDLMEREGFAWWKRRMAASAKLYDVIRIDHFIGISRYYAIPAGDTTAQNGVWVDGPGEALIAAIGGVMGGKRIIAEDLGVLTPAVNRLRKKSGYPGMKLMTFAFDSDVNNTYLPCYYEKNCVVYGGTHDNETLNGYFSHQSRAVLRFARDYLNVAKNSEIPWAILRAGYASVADTAIFQMQDLLGLGAQGRINTPSTLGGNWTWRLLPGSLTGGLAARIRILATTYGR